MLGLAGLQIWSVETGVALPVIGRFSAVVARRERVLILPDTIETRMVLQVLADAGKVLADGDAVSL